MITAVTTCKGRLEHLETTLPLMLNEFDRVIVVDWGCPQGSGDWAREEGASVIYKKHEEFFHASRARNFGARDVQTRKVCFLDADTMVFPGLAEEIEGLLDLSSMLIAARTADNYDVMNLNGFIALDIGQFWGVGGYNEAIEGYAIEDAYLRVQLLCERGLKPKRVSPHLLGAIQHSHEMRARYHAEPIHISSKRNYDMLSDYLRKRGITDWLSDPRTVDIAYRSRP